MHVVEDGSDSKVVQDSGHGTGAHVDHQASHGGNQDTTDIDTTGVMTEEDGGTTDTTTGEVTMTEMTTVEAEVEKEPT